jgi:hypothetical protein
MDHLDPQFLKNDLKQEKTKISKLVKVKTLCQNRGKAGIKDILLVHFVTVFQ